MEDEVIKVPNLKGSNNNMVSFKVATKLVGGGGAVAT